MSNKLIKFSARWCKQCVTYQPIWEQATKELKGWEVEEVAVDQEDGMDLAITYGVKALPTTIVIKDDDITILRGVQSKGDLQIAMASVA
jgi:thioredoxin-like negative regulator of GroEL